MKKNDIYNFMSQYNFVASKKLGQNFLHDQNIKINIVNSANLNNKYQVIEIGPGLGSITDIILEKKCNIIAVELDKRLYEFLVNKYINNSYIKLINNDILKINFDDLPLDKTKKTKIIANLPYSISSQIILKLLKFNLFDEAIIMVQKEMANRMLSKVNTSDYNAFTILINLVFDIKLLFDVHPDNFIPKPKVDSTVIKLIPNLKINYDDLDSLMQFLKISFHSRRKTLFNNLSLIYNKDIIKNALNNFNYNLNIRPQELTGLEFYKIFNYIKYEQNNLLSKN